MVLPFESSDFGPDPSVLTRGFRLCTREGAGLRAIRLHDLRHGWASIAGQHGVPLRIIQERLGHHDPAFTARQYQRDLPRMGRDGADAFALAIRSAEKLEAAES
jgi:integrase